MKTFFKTRSLKSIFAMLLSLMLLIGCIPSFSFAASAPMKDILGTYEGYYYAAQGQTGVTLTIYEEEGKVRAIFEFYNLPNRTNAKDGSFYMDVSLNSNGSYFFDGKEWIDRPSGYVTVDVTAALNGYVLSGKCSASSKSDSFYAEKANDSYQTVKDNIFNDHRYEVVDEGMTWTEAEAYAEEKGGYLTVITSAEEQTYVYNLIKTHTKKQYWIGGFRTTENQIAWVTGEEFDYTNFSSGEPNNYRNNETALQMFREESPYRSSQPGDWNDAPDDNTISGQEDFFSLSNVGFVIEYGVWSDSSQWASDELQDAYDSGLIPDVLIGTDLSRPITRGEFAAVADKLYQALSGNRMIIAMNAGFQDIDNCSERLYILKAFNYGIVNGTSITTYEPDSNLTREQMATMLTRVYKKYEWPDYTIDDDRRYPLEFTYGNKFADDALISNYAYESVYFMAANHILNGMGNNIFAPRNATPQEEAVQYANATREQALLISKRTLDQLG